MGGIVFCEKSRATANNAEYYRQQLCETDFLPCYFLCVGGSSVQPGSGGATGEQGRDRGGMANDGLNPQQVDPHVVNKARYVHNIHLPYAKANVFL